MELSLLLIAFLADDAVLNGETLSSGASLQVVASAKIIRGEAVSMQGGASQPLRPQSSTNPKFMIRTVNQKGRYDGQEMIVTEFH